MAETYDQYQKNAAQLDPMTRVGSTEFGKPLIDVAMDQTELLQGVRRRVQEFVDFYEKGIEPELGIVRAYREKGLEMRANAVEADLQEVAEAHQHHEEYGRARLLLDDLKVLLDKFPQKYS